MFERLKEKATGLQQRFLENIGQADSFHEDDDFVRKLEDLRVTRYKVRELCERAKYMMNTDMQARNARLAYVCCNTCFILSE